MKRESELRGSTKAELANGRLLAQAASESANPCPFSQLTPAYRRWSYFKESENDLVAIPFTTIQFLESHLSVRSTSPWVRPSTSEHTVEIVLPPDTRALADHPNYRLGTVRKVAGF